MNTFGICCICPLLTIPCLPAAGSRSSVSLLSCKPPEGRLIPHPGPSKVMSPLVSCSPYSCLYATFHHPFSLLSFTAAISKCLGIVRPLLSFSSTYVMGHFYYSFCTTCFSLRLSLCISTPPDTANTITFTTLLLSLLLQLLLSMSHRDHFCYHHYYYYY